jgi:hypothetical protein
MQSAVVTPVCPHRDIPSPFSIRQVFPLAGHGRISGPIALQGTCSEILLSGGSGLLQLNILEHSRSLEPARGAIQDTTTALIAIVTFALLMKFKIPEPVLILGAAVIGLTVGPR